MRRFDDSPLYAAGLECLLTANLSAYPALNWARAVSRALESDSMQLRILRDEFGPRGPEMHAPSHEGMSVVELLRHLVRERLDGHIGGALASADLLAARLAVRSTAQWESESPLLAEMWIHIGLTRLAGGDCRQAVSAAKTALGVARAQSCDSVAFEALALCALALCIDDDYVGARRELARAEEFSVRPRSATFAAVCFNLAAALIHAQTGDADRAREFLRQVPCECALELWIFYLHALTVVSTLGASPVAGLVAHRRFMQRRAADLSLTSRQRIPVTRQQALLLLAAGRAREAVGLLSEDAAGDMKSTILLAMVELGSKSPHSALSRLRKLAPRVDAACLDRPSHLLIRGIALSRLGDEAAARDLVFEAVQLYRLRGGLLPLALLPRDELVALLRSIPGTDAAAVVADLESAPELLSNLERRASLTRQERTVLEQLADHPSSATIAANLCLSPHTVKAHVSSLYKKLNVHSRDEAIAAAYAQAFLG